MQYGSKLRSDPLYLRCNKYQSYIDTYCAFLCFAKVRYFLIIFNFIFNFIFKHFTARL